MEDFERYHCQMALPGFGAAAQRKLQQARVLIVGAGGLGCPVGLYLAAAGIGTIGIADDDLVSVSNLHRQILFTPQDVGKLKAEVAMQRLRAQNPSVEVISVPVRVNVQNITDLISGYDLVVDGTDNFETKYLLNDACVCAHKPFVYGAIYQYEGQVAVLNVPLENGGYSPHYRDIFPDAGGQYIPACSEGGVLPPLAGMVGAMQAGEVLKYFTSKETLLPGKRCMINMQDGSIYQIALKGGAPAPVTALSPGAALIDYADLIKGDFQLVDVRSPAEHREFNIGGILMPLDQLNIYDTAFNMDKPIVCYCATGKRSAEAARLLKGLYPGAAVFSLKNGLRPLREAGLLK